MSAKQQLTIDELISLPMTMFPVPSYDGSKFCFIGNKSGKMEYYLLDLATGTGFIVMGEK